MSLTSSLKPRSGVYKPLTIGSHVMVNHRNSRALRNHRTPCRSEHTPKNLATGPVALWPYGCGIAFFSHWRCYAEREASTPSNGPLSSLLWKLSKPVLPKLFLFSFVICFTVPFLLIFLFCFKSVQLEQWIPWFEGPLAWLHLQGYWVTGWLGPIMGYGYMVNVD